MDKLEIMFNIDTKDTEWSLEKLRNAIEALRAAWKDFQSEKAAFEAEKDSLLKSYELPKFVLVVDTSDAQQNIEGTIATWATASTAAVSDAGSVKRQ